jgi:uncharacterized protein (DUF2345 family)
MRRGHSTVLAAAAACGVTLLIGGIAVAAIPGDGGVINGCYGKVGGVVRVIDPAKHEKCIAGVEIPISWNQQGVQGAPGTPGTPGTPGAPGVSPTVAQLASGDPHCPAGGAAITDASGSVAYVCGGSNGQDGQPFSGTFTSPNGVYSMTVTDTGISLSSGGNQLVQISGSNVNVAANNVGIVASLNASLTAGATTSVTSGQDTTIVSGQTTSMTSGADTAIASGDDTSITINGDLTTDVAGAASIHSGGNTSLDSSGLGVHSTGPVSVTSGNNLSIQAAQSMAVAAGAGLTVSAGGPFGVHSDGNMSLDTDHEMHIHADSTVTITGSNVTLN